ncbi:MAG: excinuclease ABC subunit UvrA [Phycisphaerales bacterium JB052]
MRIRGAKEHNLKSVDIDIPRDRLVIITGLSGSGKSSLAFDTIFAEGQRKYMESLSAYARQFLDQLKKPDIEEIEGIPPTIAIEQRSASHNPRSTVATTTEIYDYLRLLFARCGTPRSWAPTKTKKDGTVVARSGRPIESSSASQIVDHITGFGEGTRMMILAPVVRAKKGFHKDTLEDLFKQGWVRARVNGELIDLRDALKEDNENPLKLHRHKKHSIDAVVDRVVIRDDDESRQRLVESVEACLRIAEGSVTVSVNDADDREKWEDHAFSEHFADPDHPEISLSELSPRLFSFNSPFGACPDCHGLGVILEFDMELVIPDMEVGLLNNAIQPWKKNGPGGMIYPRYLRRFCRAFDITPSTKLSAMDDELFTLLMHGNDAPGALKTRKQWDGVMPMLHAWFHKTESSWVKDHLHQFQHEIVCPTCCGDRLGISALHVTIESNHKADMSKAGSPTVIGRPTNEGTILNISELSRLNITDAVKYIEGLKLTKEQAVIAEAIVREITNRLRFLESVGLEYLSLDRRTATLSGGEAQRIRLATQVGSGLVGACYVLDEPTIGLHQRDNDRLIRTLRHLTDIGNSVLVVEHDEDTIRAADHVIDIGPGPGVHGGTVVAQGTIEDIISTPKSLTGDYLSGRKKIEVPAQRRKLSEKKAMVVKGAAENNLKGIDVAFPIGGMICVTGVSGSGKSTLVNQILLPAVKREVMGSKTKPGKHARINGLQHIDRIIEVDQSPIGRTPRSNPATYTGIFDEIRKVFTATKEAKIRGYKPGRFSFNVASKNGGGRCEACAGQGTKKIEMHFLPDVFVECEVCNGKRYNRETLQVTYRGKNIADVLDMTVEDACSFFENHPKILRFTECLRDVGLGYITLGQPSTTLSGGEAQRVKLATELGKGTRYDGTPSSEHTLYILDEPTTGLHFEDINKLIGVLNRLADAGNTLIVIEHNLDVIKCADWINDLGPEGGDLGGTLLASGTPEAVAKTKSSYTGQYLKDMLIK